MHCWRYSVVYQTHGVWALMSTCFVFLYFYCKHVWWRIYTLYDICRNGSDRVCVFSVCECCAKIAVSTSLNYEPDRIGVPAGCWTPSCKCISVRVYFLILVLYWSAYGQSSLILIQCHFLLLSNYRFNSLWPSNVMWRQRYLGQHWMR